MNFRAQGGDPYFNSLSIKMVSPLLCAGKPDAFVKAKADRMYESIDEKDDAKGKKEPLQRQAAERVGVSISLKENWVCLKGGRDPLTAEQEVEE
jgi:hypothetical protein